MRYLLPLLILLTAPTARAVDYYTTVLVKEQWTSGYQPSQAGLVPSQVVCRRVAFSPQREAPISPFSNDPRVPTSDASILYWPANDCSVKQLSNGSWVSYFHFRAQSLKDLGQHVLVCEGQVSPVWSCVSSPYTPPCYISCHPAYVQTAVPIRWYVEVANALPEAFPSYTPAQPAWNSTVTLAANGRDLDNPYSGDSNTYRWSITSQPPTSTASLRNAGTATPSITFGSERDIGAWRFRLEVDDNEGELRAYETAAQLNVPNALPSFEISGLREVTIHSAIQLGSSKLTDDDGGNLTFRWDVLKTPPQAAPGPQENFSTAQSLTIATGLKELGEWEFRLTATDNEGASVSKTAVVKVVNAKPRIAFSGSNKIRTGQNLAVSTTVLTDDDGGNLSFLWEVVQEPGSSGPVLPYVISTSSSVSKPSLWHAGTWIFRLTATDDEGESTQGEFQLLVDGDPWVSATDVQGEPYDTPDYALPTNRGELVPLLYGWTGDTDSPCPESPSRCHRTDGRAPSISAGIVRHEWHIIQLPEGLDYFIGACCVLDRVSASFPGVRDDGPVLDFGFHALPEGLWGFELRVWDAEGNTSSSQIYLHVQLPAVPPTAVLVSTPAQYGNRVSTPLSGILPFDLAFDGTSSHDLDNRDPYDPYYPQNAYPGMGIVRHQWQAFPPTAGCAAPTLTETAKVTLYRAGAPVAPECQGRWRVRLTVTDDDRLPRSTSQETTFSIGNCPGGRLCLDTPHQVAPAVLSPTGGVFIGYHIDSALYDEALFGLGVSARLEVFSTQDSINPLYTAVSAPATQASRGRGLLFYWNGYTQSGARVPEGALFDIKVSLLDASNNVLGTRLEYRAISTEPVQFVLSDGSPRYIRVNATAPLAFTLTGAQTPVDSFRGTLRDELGSAVATFTAPASATSMSLKHSVPGKYTLELGIVRGGTHTVVSSLPVIIYQYQLRASWWSDPAADLRLLVNNDDDNLNGVKDSEEAMPAGDDEVVALELMMTPALDGALTLEHTLGADALRAWSTLSKSEEVALPRTWSLPAEASPSRLYLEPLAEAAGEVRLRFTTADGAALETGALLLNTLKLEALEDSNGNHSVDDEDLPAGTLRPGRWFSAYDPSFNLLNGADPQHFVEMDPSRFYIRARGPRLSTDPARAETLLLQSSIVEGWTRHENQLPLQLVESGPHTATLVSRSQLLTGLDIEGILRMDTDDGYPTHDGGGGLVGDNTLGDRTWRASIDSHLMLYYSQYNSQQTWRQPVCGAWRRKVPIRVRVFMEPFQDVGIDPDGNPSTPDRFGALNGEFDFIDANSNGRHDLGERSEPYVDLSSNSPIIAPRSGDDPSALDARGPVTTHEAVLRELRHANSLWASACIKAELIAPILFENAPTHEFTNILMDGVMVPNELPAIYKTFGSTLNEDVVEVFYGTRLLVRDSDGAFVTALGMAFAPLHQSSSIPHGEKSFVVISSNFPTFPALAHELAHVLTNTGDSPGNQALFYPTQNGTPLTTVNSGRRMTPTVEADARAVRRYGDYTARGNRVLQSY